MTRWVTYEETSTWVVGYSAYSYRAQTSQVKYERQIGRHALFVPL